MNKVRIHINELGPVRNQDIELAPVMLFTGESSLGKSYVNFLAYYVFNVFSTNRLEQFLSDHFPEGWESKKDFDFNLSISDLVAWMKADVKAFFQYLYHYDNFRCDVDFIFTLHEDVIRFRYNMQNRPKNDSSIFVFHTHVDNQTIVSLSTEQSADKAISRSFRALLCNKMLGIDIAKSILLPPGRASLLTGDYNTQKGSSQLGLYDLFLSDNAWINNRNLRNIKKENVDEFFIKYIHQLIKGDLIYEKDGLYLYTYDGEPVPIAAAASSIRELLPLLQLIQGGSIANFSVCLEEPEAHLHPEMQVGVADLLTACIQSGTCMQITTHSDYFMQRVNQLIKYGIIKNRDERMYTELCKKTRHDEGRYLDKELMKTYFFRHDNEGTVITPLEIDYNGIPMSTFFHAVENLTSEDVQLNEVIDTFNGND